MRSIDIHAHVTPQCFWRATREGGEWHTLTRVQDSRGREVLVSGDQRGQLPPKASWTPEQRLADMDSLGVDIHVLSLLPAWGHVLGVAPRVQARHDVGDDARVTAVLTVTVLLAAVRVAAEVIGVEAALR